MLIQPISYNQQNFKAVNQKYLNWAKEDIARNHEVTTEWIRRLGYDVYLLKKITHKDAIDTINAVKKITNITDLCLEELLKGLHKTNPSP